MNKKTLLLAAGAVSLMFALLVWQRHTHEALRAENTLLRALADETRPLDRLRRENQLLLRRKAEAEELARWRNDSAEMERLRGEVTTLRRQLAERARTLAETPPSTNSLALDWPAGELLPKETWRDAGQASPLAAVATFFWAVNRGDVERLRQLVRYQVPPESTNDYHRRELDCRQEELNRVRAVRLASLAWSTTAAWTDIAMNDSSKPVQQRVSVNVEMIHDAPAEANATNEAKEAKVPSKRGFLAVGNGQQWMLELPVPPKCFRLSLDPAERARQISELPPEMQKALKSLPPDKSVGIKLGGL